MEPGPELIPGLRGDASIVAVIGSYAPDKFWLLLSSRLAKLVEPIYRTCTHCHHSRARQPCSQLHHYDRVCCPGTSGLMCDDCGEMAHFFDYHLHDCPTLGPRYDRGEGIENEELYNWREHCPPGEDRCRCVVCVSAAVRFISARQAGN